MHLVLHLFMGATTINLLLWWYIRQSYSVQGFKEPEECHLEKARLFFLRLRSG